MHYEGHIGLALVVYAPFAAVSFTSDLLLTGLGGLWMIACSLAPDIDSCIKADWLPHRGPTHSLFFAIVVAVIGFLGFSFFPPGLDRPVFGAVIGFVGVSSHLVADVSIR